MPNSGKGSASSLCPLHDLGRKRKCKADTEHGITCHKRPYKAPALERRAMVKATVDKPALDQPEDHFGSTNSGSQTTLSFLGGGDEAAETDDLESPLPEEEC